MKTRYITVAAAIAFAAPATMLAAQTAAPALTTKSGTIGTPAAGKGQVVFFRPGSFVGGALGCTVHEGPAQIARLGSGKYWVSVVEPGKHAYNTEGEAKDVLNIEVEADETYYVKCNIGMGVMSGRANLSPATVDDFAKKAKGLTLWKAKPGDEGKIEKPAS